MESYLLAGKLAEGEQALQARLTVAPQDDQARFGLGVVQFLQTFEHAGASAYRYGLRTERTFLRTAPEIRELLPQNPNPETLTYPAARQILQTVAEDLAKVEATLAAVKDPSVKLPLYVALVKFDLFGQKTPVSAVVVLQRLGGFPGRPAAPAATFPPASPDEQKARAEELQRQAAQLVVTFDRGDVNWLRGYCHFAAAWCELFLSVDGEHAFDCGAHLWFENVKTPYPFLMEDRRPLDENPFGNRPVFSDVLSMIHQMIRLPVKEPARVGAALAHLEAMVSEAKEMWKFILAEADDENEWIPNPKQHSVVGVNVTQEMVDVWNETLDEAGLILKGEKLIPFWRGEVLTRGVNFRRVFTEPRTFDLIEWIQGVGAAPYLEEGPLTKFADSEVGSRMSEAFGGPANFIGFGFWFN
ncbi:MAG TPA: hypothetical protein VGE52_00315 [Pirellulales bacterium]